MDPERHIRQRVHVRLRRGKVVQAAARHGVLLDGALDVPYQLAELCLRQLMHRAFTGKQDFCGG
jgi:hypothetical protein